MHFRSIISAVVGLLVIGAGVVRAGEPTGRADAGKQHSSASAAPRKPLRAIESGLSFLANDAAKWRTERGCATCHHGTMTVWALSEAKARGFEVDSESLADTIEWTKDQFVPRISKPRDPRPGWSLVSVPAIYLGMMAQNLPVLSRDEINLVATHLARHQESDGAWLLPPPANGAPPTWESPETLALLAMLAWEPYASADPKEAAAARASREKAVTWLSKTKPSDTTQATTLRLLLDVRTGKSAEQLQPGINQLLKRQNADGGWSQAKDLASDGYATGQALYVLSFAGVKNDRPEIQRAIAFLTATQRDDGSWPMTSRNHPGVESTKKPIRNPVPITYFGSAWAMLGLVRSVSPAQDSTPKQQHAFDQILGFHGKFDRDEKHPDRPVIRVDLRYYDPLSDEEVANFSKALQAFPQLATLQIKSTNLTDAGLAHLKALTSLRELRLEGTKVTDTGVQEFQKALPHVKVSR